MRLSVELVNKHGLHARPISKIIQVAQGFQAELTVTCGEQQVNGRSIFDLMSLSAGPGTVLTLDAEGDDAAALLAALDELIRGRFGED